MTDEIISDVAGVELPFGRSADLKNVMYGSGLNMLRLTLREGRRFTIIDLDQASAKELGTQLVEWAEPTK
ncbi:MAG: hypothetical protein GY947_07670 [Rhodobacteraceae bacterium]|nr:hypothetical protein [Paracoccaceae bacterium]